MRNASRGVGVALATAGLVVAAAVPTLGQSQAPGDWPGSGTLKDGSTFTLAPRIAQKLANGEPINYVFSYQSPSIALFSDQYKAGYETTLPQAQEILPTLQGQIIAPATGPTGIDVPQQVAQIQALLDTESIDCLSIEPPDSNAFTAITNAALAAGIPVFTVGVTSNGNELTNFTQVPMNEGKQAAEILLQWMEENDKDLKVFAVSGGDPTSFWGQGRMKSFRETIQAAIPDARFVNDETNALNVTFRPEDSYAAYSALITNNPDLQFIENVDVTAEHAGRAIIDAGKEGEIFTLGWNVSQGQLDMIDRGIQVVALDQRWAEQAGFGALACADFLANGIIRPNTQELFPITKENSAQARADLEAILSGAAAESPAASTAP
jgi:simple sugar transport system substrate-binding protein